VFNQRSRFLFIVMAWTFLLPDGAGAADPTRPSYYKTKNSKKTFQLESILYSGSRKVAVINGSVVAEGDTVDGWQVLNINKNKVRIKSNGKVMSLVLRTPTIRQEK
jgi:hypothetical protein